MLTFSWLYLSIKKNLFQILKILQKINFSKTGKYPIVICMNTFYIEKNTGKTTVFQLKNASFQLVQEFPASEQNACGQYIKTLPPAQIFTANHINSFDFWLNINTSHNPLDWIEKDKNSFTFDYRLALLAAALAHPKICERNFQEGITLIIEHDLNFFSALIYKNNVYGAFEHTLTNLTPELLKKDLEEFRFGWLPHEEVIRQKGACSVIKNPPTEAEGFHPTFIVCEHPEFFTGLGRFITIENIKETMVQTLQSIS